MARMLNYGNPFAKPWQRARTLCRCALNFSQHFCFMITLCLINSSRSFYTLFGLLICSTSPSFPDFFVFVSSLSREPRRPCGITEISACYVHLWEIHMHRASTWISLTLFPRCFGFWFSSFSTLSGRFFCNFYLWQDLFPFHNKLRYL